MSEVNIPLETRSPKREVDGPKKDKKEKKAKKANVSTSENTKPTISIEALGELLKTETQITKVVLAMCEKYPEVAWLTSKTNVTPEGIINNKDQKLSVQMFGETHIEFDKTVVSIFCILWLLSGDLASFTACQPGPIKLTQTSFDKLRKYVMDIFQSPEALEATKAHNADLKRKKANGEYSGNIAEPKDEKEWKKLAEDEAIEALAVFTVLNDLGKVESVVQLVRARTAVEEVDHDKILWMGLRTNPKLFPSYEKLGTMYQNWLLEGLGAQFNFAQLVQAESVPGTLGGLKNLSKMALDLFNLHALFDMAGAAGHIKYNGSIVLTEPTYQDMFVTIKCMEEIANGATANQVYDTYLHERGKTMQFLDSTRPTEKAALRICCNLRFHTKEEAQTVIAAIDNLPRDVWNNLRKELCVTGIDDGWAILLYYAPALLLNCQSALRKPNEPPNVRGIELGMIAMNKCYLEARKHIKDRKGNGVFTADIADIAALAKTPENILKASIVVNPVGEDSKLSARFDEDSR